MKLIGAGLPRTATLTQKISLEILGQGPCYHMVNILGDMSLVPQWIDAFEGKTDWNKVFEGHQATVDWPGAFFYRELIEVYPDAKVLLSVRDGASWARSMRDTIWGCIYGEGMMRDLSNARCRIDQGWNSYIGLMTAMWEKSGLLASFEGELDEPALARAMERYNAEVQAAVPADRLLVWKPADGWEPLCEFLDVPVPGMPLPKVNDSAGFADRINEGAIAALVAWREQLKAQAAV